MHYPLSGILKFPFLNFYFHSIFVLKRFSTVLDEVHPHNHRRQCDQIGRFLVKFMAIIFATKVAQIFVTFLSYHKNISFKVKTVVAPLRQHMETLGNCLFQHLVTLIIDNEGLRNISL